MDADPDLPDIRDGDPRVSERGLREAVLGTIDWQEQRRRCSYLLEVHLALGAVHRAPVTDAPLQRAYLAVVEPVGVTSLQLWKRIDDLKRRVLSRNRKHSEGQRNAHVALELPVALGNDLSQFRDSMPGLPTGCRPLDGAFVRGHILCK
ncbi:MAG: hypothetical protein IT379_21970 [Deltaproteobacteria bacterium]|nr:hypothetical protein [Deltaproteobacteria bacterium]